MNIFMKYKSHLFQVYINIIKSVSKMEEQHQRVFICDESSHEKLTITLPLNNRSAAHKIPMLSRTKRTTTISELLVGLVAKDYLCTLTPNPSVEGTIQFLGCL